LIEHGFCILEWRRVSVTVVIDLGKYATGSAEYGFEWPPGPTHLRIRPKTDRRQEQVFLSIFSFRSSCRNTEPGMASIGEEEYRQQFVITAGAAGIVCDLRGHP